MILRFAHPWLLLTLLLVPIVAWQIWRQKPPTLRYSNLDLLPTPAPSFYLGLRWLPLVLRLGALTLLALALARPQSGRETTVIHGEGVDIILAFDVSPSMAALDFDPVNRFEAARQVMLDFIADRAYDRIGLVIFSGQAFTQSPPTFDYEVLTSLLSEIELGLDMGLEGGTAIGMGLAQASRMLQDSTAESRVIILLTDGVNNAGQIDPFTAAQAAAALDIKVYTIGVGRDGQVPFPVDDPLFGSSTQMVESELDEETLQQIADLTGGLYFRATDTDGLAQIYDRINIMEKSKVEVQVLTQYTERAVYFLLPALLLLLCEFLLHTTLLRSIP
jgi:Ca-activated chloride channel homolog